MNPYSMMQTAAALFGLAAFGGLLMAGMRFSGTPRPPMSLAMGHGVLAAAGITLLVYAAMTAGLPHMAQLATVLFVTAATGGAVMNLLYHRKMRPLPISLMLLHATIALVGFVLLLEAIYEQMQVA